MWLQQSPCGLSGYSKTIMYLQAWGFDLYPPYMDSPGHNVLIEFGITQTKMIFFNREILRKEVSCKHSGTNILSSWENEYLSSHGKFVMHNDADYSSRFLSLQFIYLVNCKDRILIEFYLVLFFPNRNLQDEGQQDKLQFLTQH